LVITVAPNPAAPVITSVLSGTGAVGIPYSYAIAATNNPTSYSAVGLPAGLNITSTNGIIAGTPTTAGTSNVTIEAINSSGIGPATFVMTVLPATKPPVFTSGTNVAGDAGLAFNDQVTVTNTPVTFAATGLPGGIGINPSTGFVSGTPTVSGTFIATVTASNIAGTGTSNLNFILGAPGADINLALNHSASVSSTENATNLGPDAVDGNTATRWESLWSDPQWFYVDLGAEQTVHSVVIDWENASGKDYLIQTSDDGYTWSVVESVTNNTLSGVLTYPGINTHARYVRMSGTQRTTIYGYSIWEFQVLGLPNQSGTTPPVITSGTVATGAEGSPFGYQVTATNSPTSYNAVGLPPGLSINPGTGAITGTAAASGTCAVIISGSNAAGVGATQLFLTTLPPFTAWQNQVFTQSALSDPAVSGMTASPANDGIPNLMKYALHINPNVNGAGGLPAVSNSSAGGQEYLTLTYTQVIAASDITYTVEVSGDMQTWSSGPGYTTTVSVTNNPDGVTQTVVARDMTPEASAYNRYIRLKVTMP
jgi:hypothetical protein